jgi:hypothetical protein
MVKCGVLFEVRTEFLTVKAIVGAKVVKWIALSKMWGEVLDSDD